MPRVYNKFRENPPPGARYIGRGSIAGNPFLIGVDDTLAYAWFVWEKVHQGSTEIRWFPLGCKPKRK